MKRFYLFLGLCALTANTSFAVQTTDSGTSRLGGIRTNKITDSSETKKHFFPLKNTNTPVLSAITNQKTTTFGPFAKNENSANNARITVNNKVGLNKKNLNSYQYNTPNTNIPSPQNQSVSSQEVTALQNRIDELQAQIATMQNALNAKADIDEVAHQNNIIDNKIAQIEYKTDSLTNDTIPNTVRNVLANENVMTWSDLNQTMTNVESAINRAKNYAIETAAADANAKYVKTATFTDQVNSVLDSHGELLTADSTDLSNKINTIIAENNFVKSADFASKLRENNVLNTTDKNELATLINTAKNAAIAAADESASNKFVQNGNDLRNKVGTLLAENEVLKKADKNELARAISDVQNAAFEAAVNAQNAAVEAAAADAASKYLTTSSTGLSERITDAVAEMGFVKNTDFADKLYENGVLNSTDKAELIAAIGALQNAQDDALTPEDVDEIITGNGFIKGNDQIITDIYGRINQNKEDIARNKENIDDTTQDINGLTSRLDSDETKINNNTSRLGDAETQITTNKTNIEKNKNRFNDYTTKEEIEADYTKTAQLAQILSGKETETNLTRAVSEMLDPFATKNSLDDYTKTSGLDGAIATAFAKNGSQLKNKVTHS